MNHYTKTHTRTAQSKILTLLAVAGVGSSALICTGGFSETRNGAIAALNVEGKTLDITAYNSVQQFSIRPDADGAYRLQQR